MLTYKEIDRRLNDVQTWLAECDNVESGIHKSIIERVRNREAELLELKATRAALQAIYWASKPWQVVLDGTQYRYPTAIIAKIAREYGIDSDALRGE